MTSTKRGRSSDTAAEHWAATVAQTVQDVERVATAQRSSDSAAQTTLKTTVERELDAWLDQLTAAVVDAAAAYNAQLSSPAVKAARDARGVLSVLAPAAALRTYLLIALESGEEFAEGVMVTSQTPRERTVRSFPFVVDDGGHLVLELAGESHGPVSVARVLMEPWLRALPVSEKGPDA